jgi:hypothetical protein
VVRAAPPGFFVNLAGHFLIDRYARVPAVNLKNRQKSRQ